jgi:hypothetical protein
VAHDASGLMLTLDPDVDPVAVLSKAQSVARVQDFELARPSLSELFRSAVAAR